MVAVGGTLMDDFDVPEDVPLMTVPDGAIGPSRGALLIALIDRARHDRRFAADLRDEPVRTAARLGITLRTAEWAGLRELLTV
jgi:hypothetical protein